MSPDPGTGRWYRLPPLWARIVVLGALIAVLVAVASSDILHGTLTDIFRWAETIIRAHPVAGAFLFVALSALSAMLAFVSGVVLVPAVLGIWGETGVVLLLWSGWMLGGVCAHSIARFLGRPVVARLSSRHALARYEQWVSPTTPAGLVLLFQLAVPSEIPGYVLGLARYPLGRYLAVLAIAELPFAIGAVWLGTGFLERKTLVLVAVGVAGIAFSLLALLALRRRIERERAE